MLVCGARAAAGAIAVHAALPDRPLIRLFAVAVAIVAIYAALIARIDRITPRTILRIARGVPGTGPGAAGGRRLRAGLTTVGDRP